MVWLLATDTKDMSTTENNNLLIIPKNTDKNLSPAIQKVKTGRRV
jgi:hypothetical protein